MMFEKIAKRVIGFLKKRIEPIKYLYEVLKGEMSWETVLLETDPTYEEKLKRAMLYRMDRRYISAFGKVIIKFYNKEPINNECDRMFRELMDDKKFLHRFGFDQLSKEDLKRHLEIDVIFIVRKPLMMNFDQRFPHVF